MTTQKFRRILLQTTICALALLGVGQATAVAATLPAGFEEDTLVSGLTRPTAVDWTPDGRLLVAEKDGVLKALNPGESTPETIYDIRPQVNAGGDRGLLGLAVDTAFATNHYVYLLYTYELDDDWRDSHEPMVSQLLRVELEPDNEVTNPVAILGTATSGPCPDTPANTSDCLPSDSDGHSIGTVRSAPDGTLYVGNGDNSGYGDTDPRALRTYNEQSFSGKIIHIDRAGRGLPGHPFCPENDNLDHACTKIWAKGFRNPFRFSLSPIDGLIVGDVGWGAHEEINLVGSGGGSYGWPCVEGPEESWYALNPTDCPPALITAQIAPTYSYPHPDDGGGASVVGGPRYAGTAYPDEFDNAIIFGDYVRGTLSRLVTGGPEGPTVHPFGTDWYGSVDLTEAPDNGDIVYVSFGDGTTGTGSVERIVYSPENSTPVARATANPVFSPTAPLTVEFDAHAPGDSSFDPDGDDLTYHWEFDDGATSTDPAPTHEYTELGTYEAVLTVDDGEKTDSDTVTVSVGNSPPDPPQIVVPESYRGGETLVVRGTATDPEDGEIPSDGLSWNVQLIHNDHHHPFVDDQTGSEIQFTDPASHDADSYYEVRLTATDSGPQSAPGSNQLSTTEIATIHPEKTTITLLSEPPGAPISYYDSTFTAPLTRETAIGLETGVAAHERFTVGDQEYLFSNWSDGGDRIHPFTVPEAPTTLVAYYEPVAGPPTPDPGPDRNPSNGDQSDPRQPIASAPPASTAPEDRDNDPEHEGPLVRVRGGDGLNRRATAVRGHVRDPQGVMSVAGAIYRPAGKGRCRFWSARRERLLKPRTCRRPEWIKAKLAGPRTDRSWRLRLGAALPPGRYRLVVVAEDRKGNRSDRLGGRRSLRLTVR